jgi:hypothetical protein
MLTVGQLRENPLVTEAAGSDGTSARFLTVLNRAVETLMEMGSLDEALQEYCFDSCHKCIYLPPEIKAIRKARVNGRVAGVFNRVFQYQPNGPAEAQWCGREILVDKGPAQFFNDQPGCPAHLLIVTDECEDAGKWLRITGLDINNRPVISPTTGKPYVEFDLGAGKAQFFEAAGFSTITGVTKSQTRGNVYVYEFYPELQQSGNLLTLVLPWQQSPEYRKYQVNGVGDGEFSVTLLAERRHVPLYHDAQAVLIDSTNAIIAGIQYNRALDNRDMEGMGVYRTEISRIMLDLRRTIEDGQERRVTFNPVARTGHFRRLGGR